MLTEYRGGETHTFGFDPSSNTRLLTDGAGSVTAALFCDAFGRERGAHGASNATPFRFGGECGYWHDGVDRVYVRARYYDVAAGRWLSGAPLTDQRGDWNLYRYAGNAAGLMVDPSGNAPTAVTPISKYLAMADAGAASSSSCECNNPSCGVPPSLSASCISPCKTVCITCYSGCTGDLAVYQNPNSPVDIPKSSIPKKCRCKKTYGALCKCQGESLGTPVFPFGSTVCVQGHNGNQTYSINSMGCGQQVVNKPSPDNWLDLCMSATACSNWTNSWYCVCPNAC